MLALFLSLAGAGGQAAPPLRVKVVGPRPVAVATVAPPAEALAIYLQRCATCHGDKGRGDGPAAAGLMVKPRRFSDAFWQDSESDLHLAKAIVEGGFAVRRSSAMPPHPDLKAHAAGLVAVVRAFRSATGSVAVQTVRENGEVIATFTADADASGAGVVEVRSVPPEAVAVVGRVSGHPEPVCRVPLAADAAPREATCAAELASVAAPSPPAPPQEPR